MLTLSILWIRKNSEFEAFPSREYMAKALGVSTDTINRAIKELKEKAELKVIRKGLGKNNHYRFPDWDSNSDSKKQNQEFSKLQNQKRATLPSPIVRDNNKRNTFVGSPLDVFEYFKEKKGKRKEKKTHDDMV